ncbi:polysaccharide deacetylase family protein [Paenibacillus methanolicus]|uniref:Peptidoglycan/xylan/chitin deacetylase (PgdA/CDA1 family) n=1 Tax=Paenibacillus methanolicus TaxID=582686 RepID=A0A5S5BZ87_9BACL|nr:polysaccharide deacetylase family protein [Paenibacillus methanolicus]TYP71380.1 peptidoglycan/xylan/chitin deacetylase (PgdA/CDA1 family) [Paenibacillus methanolicus]
MANADGNRKSAAGRWLTVPALLVAMQACAACALPIRDSAPPHATPGIHATALPSDSPAFQELTDSRQGKRSAGSYSWLELQRRYPGTFFVRGSRGSMKVALTFDDVPDPRYTPKVLDLLAKYRVRATFFVLGSKAKAYPAIVARMRKEGHMIANHSYDHPVFTKISVYQFGQQVTQTDRLLRSLAGYSPRFVRPPYGAITPRQIEWAQANGYTVVNWDVDSEDWRSIGSGRIMTNIKSTLQPGSIILQHAGGGPTQDLSGTVQALPQLIQFLRKKGYDIVPLPELLGRPVARSPRPKR